MPNDWTINEVKAIVEDYFQMLRLELNHHPYVKSKRRKLLSLKLNNRSEGSIEFKHQNISAVLMRHNCPFISGYKPRMNYQTLLEEVVLNYLEEAKDLEVLFSSFSSNEDLPLSTTVVYDFNNFLKEPPTINFFQEDKHVYQSRRLFKTNYLEVEQRNRTLGELGEKLVFSYERWRLLEAGKDNLSERVEWISKDKGDGAGFDILSKNLNGTDRFIEVKTTKLSEFVPIYLTRNELVFSQENKPSYYLYRVYNFMKSPKMFIKHGAFDDFCKLEPISFIGNF